MNEIIEFVRMTNDGKETGQKSRIFLYIFENE
jgi:hypothetical protein